MFGFGDYSTQMPKPPAISKREDMKKIKPLTEGRVKSQIKTYTGEEPKTQAPPPPKPPKVCGEWQVNNKTKSLFDNRKSESAREEEFLKEVAEKLQGRELFPELNQRAKEMIENSNMKEMVNGPQHYGGVDNPYEVIKVCEAWGLDKDAYLFNVVKYVARAGKKDPQKELEDLKKAIFYLQRKVENLQK